MRVKWKFPDREGDFTIHVVGHEGDRTICGLANEGECRDEYDSSYFALQTFVPTRKKADCQLCYEIWKHCKEIQKSEFS